MSDELSEENAGGVSPARKAVSAVVLVVLLIILVIEIRAGAGHSWSTQALADKAPNGAFPSGEYSYEKVQSLLSMSPAESVARESETEIEYQYSWFSLLRPLLNKPETNVYVVFSKTTDEKWASFHSTEKTPQNELDAAKASREAAAQEEDGDPSFGDPAGANGTGPGASSGFRPPGGGLPRDATVALLDNDSNGEISEEEMNSAAQALLAGDTNGDGKLSGDELRPIAAEGGSGERRRPPMDDES